MAVETNVAYGCVKYANLSHNRNHEYIFSFDKMLEDKGDTAVYMLYVYTRARPAKVTDEQLEEVKKAGLQLKYEKELKLAHESEDM